MRKLVLLSVVFVLCLGCNRKQTVKFLQLNVWQEGTMVKGGYDALVDELARTDADFVMLSEVRNYDGTRFCDRITASLISALFFQPVQCLIQKDPNLSKNPPYHLCGELIACAE